MASNLFIIPLDLENRWFRYHHLFRQLLRTQMRRQNRPEEIAALHSRASRWFDENGLIEEALEHAIQAGDADWAAEIDAQSWGQVFLKYIISHPAATIPIPGTSKPHHAEDNMSAMTGRLPGMELREEMGAFVKKLL